MLRLTLRLLLACLFAIPFPGCATLQSGRPPGTTSAYSSKKESGRQRNVNSDADEVDEDIDDSEESVADERRGELVLDEPLDPWFGKYNYADKGRAIERNLR
ncbi:MAG: hypothetical protein KDB01_04005 [Planctomycetaceae bacterium]|nr:hypothetical protein [Planctomycetaceae bacterium]